MRRYSRPIRVFHLDELAAGDLVDISVTDRPCWAVFTRVGACDDDPDAEDRCDGDCLGVVFYTDDGEDSSWHVDQPLRVRLLTDVDQAEIDAQNDAHAAAAAARFATVEALT